MKQFAENAQELLDNYLQDVRRCLQDVKSVDADEIQRDITEHIAQELESAQEPVSADDLDAVLRRLGSPRQWAPQNESGWFRKMALRLRTGPDDWRLAYIAFGLFILTCVSGPGAILFLPLSFYIGRVTLSIAGGPHRIGNQKYLIYPALALVHFIVTAAVLAWPFSLLVFAKDIVRNLPRQWTVYGLVDYWHLILFVTLVLAGAWWLIVGVVLWRRGKKIYYPLPAGLATKIGPFLCVLGAILVLYSLLVRKAFLAS